MNKNTRKLFATATAVLLLNAISVTNGLEIKEKEVLSNKTSTTRKDYIMPENNFDFKLKETPKIKKRK